MIRPRLFGQKRLFGFNWFLYYCYKESQKIKLKYYIICYKHFLHVPINISKYYMYVL